MSDRAQATASEMSSSVNPSSDIFCSRSNSSRSSIASTSRTLSRLRSKPSAKKKPTPNFVRKKFGPALAPCAWATNPIPWAFSLAQEFAIYPILGLFLEVECDRRALPASMAYRPRESRGIMIKIGGESDSGRQAQRWRQTHGSMSVNQSEQIRQAWSSGSSSSCSRSRSCQRLLLSTVLAITPSSSRRFLALATRSSRVPAWFQV